MTGLSGQTTAEFLETSITDVAAVPQNYLRVLSRHGRRIRAVLRGDIVVWLSTGAAALILLPGILLACGVEARWILTGLGLAAPLFVPIGMLWRGRTADRAS
jgi:hypothetical protein